MFVLIIIDGRYIFVWQLHAIKKIQTNENEMKWNEINVLTNQTRNNSTMNINVILPARLIFIKLYF